MNHARILIEDYPEIAEILSPELSSCATADVETLLRRQLGVESIESFGRAFRRLRRGAGNITKAVPAAMPILRSVAPLLPVAGQIAGTMIGGPAGAMVGGAVGNMAGQALGGRRGRGAAVRAAALGPAAGLPGAMPASAKLLSVLGRPEILKALTAMALGPAGNPNASVGGRQVPVAAIANLIGSLAQQAEEEFRIATEGEGESLPEYLTDGMGTPCCDVADSDERAERLYELLVATGPRLPRRAANWPREAEVADDWEYEDEFDSFDDAELGEVWANEALEWE